MLVHCSFSIFTFSTFLWLALVQMALARADSSGALFNGPVVVLADKSKEDMDELVSSTAAAC